MGFSLTPLCPRLAPPMFICLKINWVEVLQPLWYLPKHTLHAESPLPLPGSHHWAPQGTRPALSSACPSNYRPSAPCQGQPKPSLSHITPGIQGLYKTWPHTTLPTCSPVIFHTPGKWNHLLLPADDRNATFAWTSIIPSQLQVMPAPLNTQGTFQKSKSAEVGISGPSL